MTVCLICRRGDLELGFTTISLEDKEIKLIIKGVPANICDTCGEAYLDESIASRVMQFARGNVVDGVLRDTLDFADTN
jgi:YgiT-type zinc finger domain-containing protein